jgi:hypothetical protein
MERQELLREQAREKLRLAASAPDSKTRQELATEAFQLAQEAEALERALVQDADRAAGGRR